MTQGRGLLPVCDKVGEDNLLVVATRRNDCVSQLKADRIGAGLVSDFIVTDYTYRVRLAVIMHDDRPIPTGADQQFVFGPVVETSDFVLMALELLDLGSVLYIEGEDFPVGVTNVVFPLSIVQRNTCDLVLAWLSKDVQDFAVHSVPDLD
jgi:hypothetical protein